MNVTQIVLTALLTVVAGTLVFVLGQIILILFIERIRGQARTVEAIAEAIINYAREYTDPKSDMSVVPPEALERLRKASENLRALSASLRVSTVTLRCYRLFQATKLVIPRSAAEEASRRLMRLSNLVPPKGHDDIEQAVSDREQIQLLLNIKNS